MVFVNFRSNGVNDSDETCFEGIYTTKVFILHCLHWFPDVRMTILLYIDGAISADTFNMSH